MHKKIRYFGARCSPDQASYKNIPNLGRVEIIAINADMVFGSVHLDSAVEHAARSFERGKNVARNLGVEIMRYASGERQISAAIDKMGAKPDTRRLVFLIIGDCDIDRILKELHLERDERLIGGDEKDPEKFGITKEELETVPKEKQNDLVLERVALVNLEK